MVEERKALVRCVVGEFLCTLIFILTVLATSVNLSRTKVPILAGTVLSGLSTGFVAVAVILAFGDVSGAHFNPAVTFGFIVTRKMPWKKGLIYMGAQVLAAICAACTLYVIFPDHLEGLPDIDQVINVVKPITTPGIQAILAEFVMTFVLVYMIFATAVDSVPNTLSEVSAAPVSEASSMEEGMENESPAAASSSARSKGATMPAGIRVFTGPAVTKNNLCAFSIGLTLGFLCWFAGTSSGGAFNPARALGPAIITGSLGGQWIYWLGDLGGGAAAALLHQYIMARDAKIPYFATVNTP